MPIDTSFAFAHEHTGLAIAAQGDFLGLLRDFVGREPADKPQRTWKGPGFNMIWRPNFDKAVNPQDFFLQLNLTKETLSFTDITGTGIANRGLRQEDIFLGGAAYLQAIDDSFDGTGQHFEPGVWANIPPTQDPQERATVVRMGSIPHGTSINLQGVAFEAPRPLFDTASITPFRIGSPDDGQTGLVHFPEEDLLVPSVSRTDLARVQSLTQAQLADPNLFLSQAIQGQNIVGTTVVQITSDSSTPGAVPDAGGGTDNIAFLAGKGTPPPANANADAARVTATFWIERIRGEDGSETLQLQYTQRVLLNFNGLSWPHVTVATLRIV